MALALANVGRVADAAVYEEREETLWPKNPEFYQQMAIKYSVLRRRAEALAAARKAVELGPDLPRSWELLVLCAAEVPKETAGDDYERAAAGLLVWFITNPNVTMYEWMTTACCFGQRKHYDVALQIHVACLRKFPKAAINWYNCGVTNHKGGRSEWAHQCYTRAIQLESNVLALVNRGWIHFERQDLAETEKDWQSAIGFDSTHIACSIPRMTLQVGLPKVTKNPELVRHLKYLGRDVISLAYDL